jgi:Clustered mitochondria/Translation initiation factor eIF3 subunit 135/Tetratricopeptide repeat
MFFKLCRDKLGLYGGDKGAAKAAKHEMKAVQSLVQANCNLFFPLICVVDFLGLRVLCTSLIDGIGDNSQVYGSSDGGQSVKADNAEMNARMREVTVSLNLCAHNTIDANGTIRCFWGPTDIEGHKITDDNDTEKFYVLDFSRLFPPEDASAAPQGQGVYAIHIPANFDEPTSESRIKAPQLRQYLREQLSSASGIDADDAASADWRPTCLPRSEGIICFNPQATGDLNARASAIARRDVRGRAIALQEVGTVYYNLLRPELVASIDGGLSSDALSNFGSCSKCPQLTLETSTTPTVQSVRSVNSPVCAHNMLQLNFTSSRATRFLHRRRIPALANLFNKREVAASDSKSLTDLMHQHGINVRYLGQLRMEVSIEYVRQFMLREMISRTARHLLSEQLRVAHSNGNPCKEAAVHFFNVVFGTSPKSSAFWEFDMKQALTRKFFGGLTTSEKNGETKLRTCVVLFSLFVQLQRCTGVHFNPSVVQNLFEDPSPFATPTPFSLSDLASIEPVAKSIGVENPISTLLYSVATETVKDARKILLERAVSTPGASDAKNAGDMEDSNGYPIKPRIKLPTMNRADMELEASTKGVEINESVRDAHFNLASELYNNEEMLLPLQFQNLIRTARSSGRTSDSTIHDEANKLLDRMEQVFGLHSHKYLLALVSMAELQLICGVYTEATVFIHKALIFVQKLHGHHPLSAKLHCFLGRLHIATNQTEEAAASFNMSYEIYKEVCCRLVE